MSKQYLLPNVERHFKASMHTHSTCSDGRGTPEEVKAVYKAQGYQIVAYTDHEICVAHPELNDDEFLALTSYEMAVNPSGCRDRDIYDKCYHMNLIARDPENTKHVCFDRGYVRDFWPASKLEIETYSTENRTYSVDSVNHILELVNKFCTVHNGIRSFRFTEHLAIHFRNCLEIKVFALIHRTFSSFAFTVYRIGICTFSKHNLAFTKL